MATTRRSSCSTTGGSTLHGARPCPTRGASSTRRWYRSPRPAPDRRSSIPRSAARSSGGASQPANTAPEQPREERCGDQAGGEQRKEHERVRDREPEAKGNERILRKRRRPVRERLGREIDRGA